MKVEFLSPLVVERIDGNRWKLDRHFVCMVDGAIYSVPAGFITDFASVPRLPLAYYLTGGRGVKAATLHDFLYETKALPRDDADLALRAALVAEGEPDEFAQLMYLGVRAGGASHYDKQEQVSQFQTEPERPAPA
jgi:hypothetical protein